MQDINELGKNVGLVKNFVKKNIPIQLTICPSDFQVNKLHTVLIGSGTLDVFVLTIAEGSLFGGRTTSEDTHLGGENFIQKLALKLMFRSKVFASIPISPEQRLKTVNGSSFKF
ncbi:hypothetical protein NPIL_476121 [Nephila pilipes]|uniref:Uncharacterized protein n=1 Tax=Nephila pilipes TaxID=299642 RepID=A0A8X6TBX8_NEPPI|nr:hypothetical protein NPIL_476121 [Nephila pilipes]